MLFLFSYSTTMEETDGKKLSPPRSAEIPIQALERAYASLVARQAIPIQAMKRAYASLVARHANSCPPMPGAWRN